MERAIAAIHPGTSARQLSTGVNNATQHEITYSIKIRLEISRDSIFFNFNTSNIFVMAGTNYYFGTARA